MSDYLIQRITAAPNVTLHIETEIIALLGDGILSGVRWKHRGSGAEEEHPIEHVFLFLGAEPNSVWLRDCLALDAHGFVKTGGDLDDDEIDAELWSGRQPLRLETSHPGVFAVGDVRSGSVKRVAAAVGEGSSAVQLIHSYLAQGRK
jgi:thioredoxin reductase (NADPH)